MLNCCGFGGYNMYPGGCGMDMGMMMGPGGFHHSMKYYQVNGAIRDIGFGVRNLFTGITDLVLASKGQTPMMGGGNMGGYLYNCCGGGGGLYASAMASVYNTPNYTTQTTNPNGTTTPQSVLTVAANNAANEIINGGVAASILSSRKVSLGNLEAYYKQPGKFYFDSATNTYYYDSTHTKPAATINKDTNGGITSMVMYNKDDQPIYLKEVGGQATTATKDEVDGTVQSSNPGKVTTTGDDDDDDDQTDDVVNMDYDKFATAASIDKATGKGKYKGKEVTVKADADNNPTEITIGDKKYKVNGGKITAA